MPSFPYEVQVQIVVTSMTLHNYIKRKSYEDVTFKKFCRHLNFIPGDFLTNVFLHSQTHKN